jgi:hypothetical protein
MSQQIIETRLVPFPIQSGIGYPIHISPSGTMYYDKLYGITYQNIDGVVSWVPFATGGNTFTGGTVTGPTTFLNGITTNSISATTYYNLPTDIRVTGGTYSSGTAIFTNNTGGTFNVSGFTTPTSLLGNYLPLSGGTLTGGLVANSGVTASTISQTSYIDFTTGSTNPSSVAGRLFFDSTQKSLSYFDITNNQVPIAMGQQLYTRVWNATGTQIDKGKVIAITGTSNNLPSAILARNVHSVGSDRPIGLAAENIPNGSEGLVINNGILSGITLNTFTNGDVLYLSDTVPGSYVASTSSISFTARTNEIGYVLETGSTTGKIYVTINNEDSNLSLTDKERNIIEGNVVSGGVYEYTGMTQGTGATINVALARGWIVKNTYEFATLPDVTNVYYTGGTNIPLTNLATADATFILINSASTLVQQTTFPTAQERREKIFLGKVVHPSRTSITSINQTVDFDVSPMAAIRDLWTPLKLINQGIIVSPHSTTLEINTSAGVLWGNGIGWTTNQQNPDSVSISGTSPTTFQYRTRFGPITGGTVPTGNTTTIYPGYYDLNGVVTAVGGGSNSSTNQRVFLFPTGLVRIQLGQKVYGTLTEAVAGSQTEQFVEYTLNRENGILIGIISVNKNATNLSLAAQAVFNLVSKFGEVLGGTGGLSTTTLQQAYDNSSEPEIVINATLDGFSIKNGTGNPDATTHLFEGQNTAGSVTSFITAAGGFSGSSVSATSFGGNSDTITGTKGTVTTSGSSTTAFINVSGSNTVGGTGYTDFIRVTNTAAGATNPTKTFRVNNTGAIEFLNSAYSAEIFNIANNGIVTISSPASVTSNSATNNALNIGTKGQLFDDGNFHIHSSSGAVWINALDGSAIRLGTQTNSGNSTVIVDTSTVGHSFFTKVQSGFNVAFGTEISMDNLKVRINGTGGSNGLVQAGAVSGTFTAYTTLLGNVAGSAVQGETNSAGITFTTTYQNISAAQKTLSAGGDVTTLHLIDTTNSRIYRITAIHCQGTTGGYTSIERMA